MAGAIGQAVNAPFEVLDGAGNVVATGTSNGDAVSLPVGDYRVRLRSSTDGGVATAIEADEEAVVSLD